MGLLTVVVAMVLSAWVIYDALSNQATPRGWASTMVVVLFMNAVQLICLGIIGEYVHRIFLETKGRPTYIIRAVRQAAEPEDQK
jgi:dolichol-phosphate mannosyltransferase